MKYTYQPRGVCSQRMEIELDGGVVKSVNIFGGCTGNLQGISVLVEGMDIDDVIARLKGIRCGFKDTSCPDQLSKALELARKKMAENN